MIIDDHFGPSITAKDDSIAFGELVGCTFSVGQQFSITDGKYTSLLWFLLSCVGEHDTASSSFLGVESFHDNITADRFDFHGESISLEFLLEE